MQNLLDGSFIAPDVQQFINDMKALCDKLGVIEKQFNEAHPDNKIELFIEHKHN